MNAFTTKALMLHSRAITLPGRAKARAKARLVAIKEDGQGTTEYAILVGVLVVVLIVIIVAFKGQITNLWESITKGFEQIDPGKGKSSKKTP